MSAKQILYSEDARKKLEAGANKLAKAEDLLVEGFDDLAVLAEAGAIGRECEYGREPHAILEIGRAVYVDG